MIYNYIHIGQPITLVSVVRCATIVQARLFPALVEHCLQIARVIIIIIITILLYIYYAHKYAHPHTHSVGLVKKASPIPAVVVVVCGRPQTLHHFPTPTLQRALLLLPPRWCWLLYRFFFSFFLADVISRVKANVLRR